MSSCPAPAVFRAYVASALLAAALAAAPAAQALSLPPVDAQAGAPMPGSAARLEASATMQVEPRHDVPTFLWGTPPASRAMTRESVQLPATGFDAESTAREQLRGRATLYRITPREVDDLEMHNLQRMPEGSALVRFRNRIGGVEVFREQVNVLLDRQGRLVSIGGFAMGAPGGRIERAPEFAARPTEAVTAALADWRFAPSTAGRLASAAAEGGYTTHALPAGVVGGDGAVLVSARSKPMWFRLDEQLLPAYYVEVQVRDSAAARDTDYYAYVIGADDLALLFRRNQTAHAAFSYRVFAEAGAGNLPLPNPSGRNGYPHPTGTPDGYRGPFVQPNLITLQNIPFSRNDPWLPPDSTKTIGNNVEAFANLLPPLGFGGNLAVECNLSIPAADDLHACTNAPNAFDYTYDTAQPPGPSRAQVMAGVTNMFYMVNFLHDWFYDAGFDEVSGNAQTDNFGRGGIAGDSISAEAQDYSGSNNALMSTPADGERPRMRMFLWTYSVALAKVNSPAAIAGNKTPGIADFGPQGFDLTSELVLALDEANSTGPTTTDGCTPFTNAAAVAGRIAVVDRGICLFADKVRNAQAAGAVGVLILNNVSPGVTDMTGDDASITIPIILIPLVDGNAIKAQLAQSFPVSMRMARASGVDREGAIDNSLVAHEWGHYISNRLIGDSVGLNFAQGFGMGEGWADFHALLLLVKEEDRQQPANANFNGTYALTAYPTSGPDFAPDVVDNAYYYGIRRYPYSRDMTRNPLTFKHITDGVPLPASPVISPTDQNSNNAQEHNTGEVWASMLWECYSNLLNDTPRLSFSEAQDRMKRYLVASYKMTPTDPTFVSARDALLSVILARDAQDHALCLAGFAKRGLGIGAVAPGLFSQTNSGVIESYMTTASPVGTTPVIEYYHAGFDHYFITWVPAEIANLDSGATTGWARTGQSFLVYTAAQPGTSPVCRYYIPPALGDSHFFGRGTAECDATGQSNPSFVLESSDFMQMFLPTAGNCPAGTAQVHRVFSNRPDANHRYMISKAIRDLMIAKGWLAEGDGPDLVVMCAPQ